MHFLGRIEKAYGEDKVLGEEFVSSVQTLLVSKTAKVNYVRTALVGANLTTNKTVEGVAKLLVKSDVQRLASRDVKDDTVLTDQRINESEKIMQQEHYEGHATQEQL